MKKRLRKKLHRGEFTEFGLEVSWRYAPGLEDPRLVDAFWDAFIEEGIGPLSACGSGDAERGGLFLNWPGRGSATEEHCRSVAAWLGARPEVAEFTVGPLQDAWRYGTD